ncbi:glycoside hydrolase family 26 protein [Galbitalea soli]|uniref:GH26 domain-containing protein n=1 Tax=Galbitalea soli TaxID=1268042 RepID=A0A7C9TRV3_9MICO|nr:glycosyl hydrolase [Galbitalea soli]NEM91959.1 hypothetical protein [Galbitalea soli]NYJ32093.1 hypothetical protein [Galbitalea soli]
MHMFSGRRIFLAVTAAAALFLTGCTAASPTPAATTAAVATPAACTVTPIADLVPSSGSLFGVNLDWGSLTLKNYSAQLGHRPAVAVSFTDLPFTAADRTNVFAAAEQVRGNGGALLLTLEPRSGLATVTPAVVADLAAVLTKVNKEGVPVIVRFAHEMNGSWYAWGEQPTLYVATFRRVALAIHAATPGTAMMWAPNYGGGYPFVGGKYQAKKGTADFRALDTNHDGRVNGSDDPYAPYYPGDDVVDWVGMSLYHWGAKPPWGANTMPEPGKFAAQLTGTYDGTAGDDRAVPNFYQVYGVTHDKPVAISETAALVSTDSGVTAEKAFLIKQAWWRQVFAPSTASEFPRLKMINWFEWDKYEVEVRHRVDWEVTTDPVQRALFTASLPSWLHYASAPKPCTPRR